MSSTSGDEGAGLPEEKSRLEGEARTLPTRLSWAPTLLETIPAVVTRVSLTGVIEYINRVLPEYGSRHPVGETIYSFAPPDQHRVMRDAIARIRETLQPTTFETHALSPSGKRDWYLTTAGPIIEDGSLTGLVFVSTNVSRVRATESALLESKAHLELALAAADLGIWRWDRRTDEVQWDERLTALFRLPPERAPRTVNDFLALVSEDQREAMGAHIGRALETGVYPEFELRLDLPDEQRWLSIKGGMLRSESGEIIGLLGAVMDVTERRHFEEQVRRLQSLEAVGQLSAGVAHNFNNMLAVVVPALELARAVATPSEAELLDNALVSASNAAQLVRDLMLFGRRRTMVASQNESLAGVVRRAADLCRRTFERRFALEVGDLEPARRVMVDSASMEQAVMNLLINARDALASVTPRPARISVWARQVEPAESQHRFPGALGDYIELCIKDNGAGMDEATQRRALEPFFTTKPAGRGTGLGLSTVWATVRDHRGVLDWVSHVDVGTTFSLLLPVDGSNAVKTARRALDRQPTSEGGKRVLVIDDEELVRRALKALVEAGGYEAVCAESGDAGVAIAQAQKFDAVLLDYSMPGMSAEDTLTGLRRAHPSISVLCVSGLGVDLPGADLQLAKPVSKMTLHAALDQILAGR